MIIFLNGIKNLIISTLASNQLIRMNFDYEKQSIIYKEKYKK